LAAPFRNFGSALDELAIEQIGGPDADRFYPAAAVAGLGGVAIGVHRHTSPLGLFGDGDARLRLRLLHRWLEHDMLDDYRCGCWLDSRRR
jgi:hypothetical protein